MKDVIALSELVEKIDFQQKLALEARHVLERDYTDRELYERCEADAKELVTSQGWLSEEEAAERTRDYALYYKKEFTTNFIKGYVEGCIRCYVILATKKKLSLEEALEESGLNADEFEKWRLAFENEQRESKLYAILGTLAEAKYQKPESAKSVWDRILSGETVSGALLGGELSGSVGLFGTVASGSIGGSVLGYEVGGKTVFGVKKKDGKIDSVGISAEGSAKGYVAKRHANAKIGDYEASVEGTVLSAEATGAIGASLYKDGKLSPQIVAEAGIKGSVLSGKAEMKHGNDTFNEHSEAKGEVLGGEAKAEAGVGVITVKNSDGKEVTAIGAKAEAGAEAYVAKGEISRGFTIFGVNIDVGVEEKAAAVGAKAGGSITTGGIQGEIGASLGLGVGINFSIDWSGFRLPWQ